MILSMYVSNPVPVLDKATHKSQSLKIFATHGIGGLVGSILTGVFAQASVNSLSGTTTPIRGGGIDGNWLQLVWQLAASFAAMFWAFIWTASPFPVVKCDTI